MAERTSRSGSRAPVNPRTKAQRIVRVQELTERMRTRQDEIDSLGDQRAGVIRDLHEQDGMKFREIATATGASVQAIHKAAGKPDRKAAAKEG